MKTSTDRRSFRPWLGVVTGAALVLGSGLLGVRPASAQAPPPWEDWYLPPADGLLDLRFGMDPATVAEILQKRGLEAEAAAEDAQLRFDGKVLGREASVLVRFVDARGAMREGRLARIELRWRWEGTLRVPRRIYDQLVDLMTQRYGAPIKVQEAGVAALETGAGHGYHAFQGPEAQVLVEIEAVRPELFRVGVRMDHPPWAARF